MRIIAVMGLCLMLSGCITVHHDVTVIVRDCDVHLVR